METVAERIQREETQDIKSILNTEYGRRFMWRLLGHCGIYRDLEGDVNDLLRQSGKRSVGLFLLSILSEVDEDKVFLMMKEAKNKAKETANASESDRRRSLQHTDTDSDGFFGDGYGDTQRIEQDTNLI